MATIKLRAIEADAPGYLKRLRQIGHMRRVLAGGWTDEDIETVVKFLLEFVDEPADPKQAEALLWDASLSQFLQMLSAIGSGGDRDNPLASE
jgi:hypothetical protein